MVVPPSLPRSFSPHPPLNPFHSLRHSLDLCFLSLSTPKSSSFSPSLFLSIPSLSMETNPGSIYRRSIGFQHLTFSLLLLLVFCRVVEAELDRSPSLFCPVPSLLDLLMPSLDESLSPGGVEMVGAIVPRVSELNETMLEGAMKLVQTSNKTLMVVLFHANWCQFSKNFRSTFDVLSSLFPFIYHMAVEESSIRPSTLSQYGVHSFPAMFLHNSTSRVRYHGSRTMEDLISFYGNATGLHPAHGHDLTMDEIHNFMDSVLSDADKKRQICPYPWAKSPEKLLREDTYFFLAAAFCICRLLFFILQKGGSSMKRLLYIITTGRGSRLAVPAQQGATPRIEGVEAGQTEAAAVNANARPATYQEGVSTVSGTLPSWLPATRQMASPSSSFTPAIAESSTSRAGGMPDDYRDVGVMKHKHPVRPGVPDDVRDINGKLQRMDLKRPHKHIWRP